MYYPGRRKLIFRDYVATSTGKYRSCPVAMEAAVKEAKKGTIWDHHSTSYICGYGSLIMVGVVGLEERYTS